MAKKSEARRPAILDAKALVRNSTARPHRLFESRILGPTTIFTPPPAADVSEFTFIDASFARASGLQPTRNRSANFNGMQRHEARRRRKNA